MAESDLLHDFQPTEDTGVEGSFVVAACSCGWTGSRHAEGTDAYAEARMEHERHVGALDDEEDFEVLSDEPY